MTSTLDPISLDGADDPVAVLASARAQKKAEDDAAREVMKDAARWVGMHSRESLVGPVDEWHEKALPLGGEGCPEVAEFAVVEFAAALGKSTESGRRYLAQVVEGRYRLWRCWARLLAGQLPAWKIGQIADRTMGLSPDAAAFVDAHVAAVAHKIGLAQLTRLIEEAIARFDPEKAEADRLAAADSRRMDVDLAQVSAAGTVHTEGELDLADALDFDAALAADAHQQLLARLHRVAGRAPLHRCRQRGPQPACSRDAARRPQRPCTAAKEEARGGAARPPRPKPRCMGAGGLARVQETRGPVTAEQVRELVRPTRRPEVTVQPVIDLAEHLHVGSYEASARLKLQTQLRDVHLLVRVLLPTRRTLRLRPPRRPRP